MTDIPGTVTVTATVQSKAEMPDGFKLELDIPSFNSKFPTICTRVPKGVADSLTVGKPHELELARQALKKSADGSPKSGGFWSDYYWGLKGIVLATDAPKGSTLAQAQAPASPVKASVPPTAAPQRPIERDDTRASIEAQTAYNGAVRLMAAWGFAGTAEEADAAIVRVTVVGMRAIQAAKADMGPGKLAGTNLDISVGQTASIHTDPAQAANLKAAEEMKADMAKKVVALAAQKGISPAGLDKQIGSKAEYKGRMLGELNWTEMKKVLEGLERLPDKAKPAQVPLTPAEQEAETEFEGLHEGN